MEIRSVKRGDEHVLIELIQQLADYENEPDAVENTPEQLAYDLFDDPICEAIVIEKDDQVLGFAIFYTSYSTWKGRCLYLEDLYVRPEARGTGAGSRLFDYLVNLSKERRCARMDWQVLNWNEPAIQFYKRKQATLDEEWINGRLFFAY